MCKNRLFRDILSRKIVNIRDIFFSRPYILDEITNFAAKTKINRILWTERK